MVHGLANRQRHLRRRHSVISLCSPTRRRASPPRGDLPRRPAGVGVARTRSASAHPTSQSGLRSPRRRTGRAGPFCGRRAEVLVPRRCSPIRRPRRSDASGNRIQRCLLTRRGRHCRQSNRRRSRSQRGTLAAVGQGGVRPPRRWSERTSHPRLGRGRDILRHVLSIYRSRLSGPTCPIGGTRPRRRR